TSTPQKPNRKSPEKAGRALFSTPWKTGAAAASRALAPVAFGRMGLPRAGAGPYSVPEVAP
ncbi:MAG TPA: hypothetical protein PK388_07160, partial [Kiritimatiellia bacterium]|nr:hypothetical protein [Kiritimatiellia bacterium]